MSTTVGKIHEQARRAATTLTGLGVRSGDTVAVQLPNRVEAAAVVLLAALLIGPDVVAWGELIDHPAIDAPVHAEPDQICRLAYTSGTTAAPKSVQHTHRRMLAELASQPSIRGGRPGDVQLASFPVGHLAGLLRALVFGVPTVILDGWDAAGTVELIAPHAVTFTAGTPFHLAALLDALEAGWRLGPLREFLVGTASAPAELVARADRGGIAAFRCYGSTEHTTVSSARFDDPLAKRQFTDGKGGR